MKTKQDVTVELLHAHLATFNAMNLEKKSGYGDRFNKGAQLYLDGKVHKVGPMHYTVESGEKKGVVYEVNGVCNCPDLAAPNRYCKHRLAAKFARLVEADLFELEKLRIQHTHQLTCDVHDLVVECWQRCCPDPTAVVCPVCGPLVPNVPPHVEQIIVEESVPVQEYIVHPDDDPNPALEEACQTIIDAQTAEQLTEDTPLEMEPEPELPPVVYTTEEYEPAPVIGLRQEPLPEAPASLNIKLRNENAEVMYTMRAHTDDEVLQRLPNVLAQLERLMHSEVDHEASFMARLAHAFFPRRKAVSK